MIPSAYPVVLSEDETLRAVLAGRSLARYGDGEFKICAGAGAKAQERDAQLTRRLKAILHDAGQCLVGIPNARSETPKSELWEKQATAGVRFLKDGVTYGSAFITRPDSAPWIDRDDYWDAVQSLWRGQDVTLVRGSGKSLTAEDLNVMGARRVTEIVGPRQHAWSEYDALMHRIGTPDRALLCLGPAATPMAVDLCAKGVHAIDLGHIGMFIRKRRRGEPMTITLLDRLAG
jgi:hypothetical protein